MNRYLVAALIVLVALAICFGLGAVIWNAPKMVVEPTPTAIPTPKPITVNAPYQLTDYNGIRVILLPTFTSEQEDILAIQDLANQLTEKGDALLIVCYARNDVYFGESAMCETTYWISGQIVPPPQKGQSN